MAAIEESVAAFMDSTVYSDETKAIAKEWMNVTRCENVDVRILTTPKQYLSRPEVSERERIQRETVRFVRRHFDARPDIVRSLDQLFAELGLNDDAMRRKEFFAFDKLYSREEVAVLLLKHLQPVPGRNRYTQEDIANHFLTSPRTIGGHIRALQSTFEPGPDAMILGQPIQMDPARGTNVPESTTHPLFLPLNMVELYTLVDVLVQHVDDPVEGRIVRSVLNHVLGQTTRYADERLARMEGFSEAREKTSETCGQQDPGDAVMFSEKEGIRATVRYVERGVEKIYTGLISRSRRNKKRILVDGEDGVYQVPYEAIIELRLPDE